MDRGAGLGRDKPDVRFAHDTLNWVIDLASLSPTSLSLSLSLFLSIL